MAATITTTDFTRIVTPTKTKHGRRVFVTIKYKDGKLSITGVEAPLRNGNTYGGGSCGQITLDPARAAFGWTPAEVERLQAIWDQWHLNHMKAGSPAQMAWIKAHRSEFPGYPVSFYDWASEGLTAAGLNPDPAHNGYRYGSSWLREEVPADVLQWLQALPATEVPHPWGE